MDLSSIGLDVSIIVAVGAIAERIKRIKGIEKYKRFFILIPVVLSVLAAVGLAINNKEWSSIFITTIKYFGVTSFGYGIIKKTILKK